MIQASVIIPHYDRLDALTMTLNGLAAQTTPADQFEVIIVDDGSTSDVAGLLAGLSLPFVRRLLRQDNKGPAAARNHGAAVATGDLLIFLDADMIPAADLIERYLDEHPAKPDAIQIGRQLPWLPAYKTRFDMVFNYVTEGNLGPGPVEPEFYHLASGNFAIPKAMLSKLGGFDECLRMTEDTDLGYRALRNNLQLLYVPEAIGYHDHPKSLRQLCENVQASAWWTAQLIKKHPEMMGVIPVYRDLEPIDLGADPPQLIRRKIARQVLATRGVLALQERTAECLLTLTRSRKLLLFFYWKILGSYRLIGFREGLRAGPIVPV